MVSSGDDGTVAAVQRDGTCARRYGTAGSAAVKSAAFVPGRGVLCCGCSDRTLRTYHADSCALQATVVDVHMDAVVLLDAAALAGDGRAALASADLSGVVALHVLARADADASAPAPAPAVLAGTFAVPDGGVPVGLALAPREGAARGLFVASASGTVTRWDCEAATVLAGGPAPAWTTRTHAACQALARAGDAALAVVGSGHSVALVRCDTGRVVHKWRAAAAPGAPSLTCVDCTRDGGVVAVGTAAGTVLLYDVRKTSAPFATATAADGRRVVAVRFLKTKTTSSASASATSSTRSVSQRKASVQPQPASASQQPPPARAVSSSSTSTGAGAVQASPIQKRAVHLELDGTVDATTQPANTTAGTTWDATVSSDVSQEASLSQPPPKQARVTQSQRALVESARALMAGDSAPAAVPWMAAGSRAAAASPPRLPSAQPAAPAAGGGGGGGGGGTLTQRLHKSHNCHTKTQHSQ